MEEKIREMMLAATLETLSLPIMYYIYAPNGFAFWCVLIAMDMYLVKHMDIETMIMLATNENYKRDSIGLMVIELAFIAGLIILCFHNLQLAGTMLLNDILMELLVFVQYANKKKEK